MQLNTTYRPALYHTAGTYRLNVGPVFYVGSTTCYGSHNSDHRVRLEKGEHPNKRLQASYDEHQPYEFIALTEIPRKHDDSDKDHTARLKLNEQWLLNKHQGDPLLANGSTSSTHNSTIGGWLKAKWQDPEFRESQIARLKSRKGELVTTATRLLLSKAKSGGNNPNSTACQTTIDGITTKFQTVKAAANHHGVKQQTMDLWMRGVVPWPGTGKRKPKAASAHLTGLTGRLI